mmetsp:Transcript_11374/g.18627  ORF Transcript_11374/g.18627 Transcript_11374/m.18627 type:complete len:142 (+) Transcript_11374:167-592(+)
MNAQVNTSSTADGANINISDSVGFSTETKAVRVIPIEFYRSSAAGIALVKALNTMLEVDEISIDAAQLILDEFDENFQQMLRDNLVLNKSSDLVNSCQGIVENYSNIDAFWKIDASDITAVVAGRELKFNRARFLFMKQSP